MTGSRAKGLLVSILVAAFMWISACSVQQQQPATGAQPAPAAAPIDLIITYNGGLESTLGKASAAFAEDLGKRSGGRINVRNSPLLQLGGGTNQTALEMIQQGQIAVTLQSPLVLANYHPKFAVLSLPFLYYDLDKSLALLDSEVGKEIGALLGDRGMLVPKWGYHGYRQLSNSKKAVHSPDDLRGLILRVPESAILTSAVKELGATPVAMVWNEALSAFQTGAVHGQENPLGIIHSAQLYDVHQYLTLWNYVFDPIAPITSKKYMESLPADLRGTVITAIEEMAVNMRKIAVSSDTELIKVLKDAGMEVNELTPAEARVFIDKMAPVYAQFESRIGTDLLNKVKKGLAG